MLELRKCKDAKIKKHANETGKTALDEFDQLALTRKLRRFVEESDLSLPKIATDMGFSAQPLACGLQEPLSRLVRSCLRLKGFLNGASEIFRRKVVVRSQKAIVTHRKHVF